MKPNSGWTMKDFRWRPSKRRQRQRGPLALPEWVSTALLIAVVLGACGAATVVVRPYAAQFVAAAETMTPDASATPEPGPVTRTAPPRPTSTRGAQSTAAVAPTDEPGVPTEEPFGPTETPPGVATAAATATGEPPLTV